MKTADIEYLEWIVHHRQRKLELANGGPAWLVEKRVAELEEAEARLERALKEAERA